MKSIPGGVDAVVMGTRPSITDDTMRECVELGIHQVWMHRGPGAGSVSPTATAYGREHGVTVIDGGCPCMFGPTADFGHKVMRVFLSSHVPSPFDHTGAAPRRRHAGGSTMGNLEVIARLTIRPGQLEGFKAQAAEIMRVSRESGHEDAALRLVHRRRRDAVRSP